MKPTILVVDDEPSIVATVCAILEAYGFSAVGATSGTEAIAKAAETCPDLLLSDVMMPGMNGFETALQVKKHCPKCALLFFTGYANVANLGVDLENNGYVFEMLSKPLPGAILVEKIKGALAR
jgi:two-component system, NtrC family, nitrogen regulation response regulator NtrX